MSLTVTCACGGSRIEVVAFPLTAIMSVAIALLHQMTHCQQFLKSKST